MKWPIQNYCNRRVSCGQDAQGFRVTQGRRAVGHPARGRLWDMWRVDVLCRQVKTAAVRRIRCLIPHRVLWYFAGLSKRPFKIPIRFLLPSHLNTVSFLRLYVVSVCRGEWWVQGRIFVKLTIPLKALRPPNLGGSA